MPATNTAPKSFPAKYAGICARTGERFQAGTAIVRDGRGYAIAETPAQKPAPVALPTGPVVSCEVADLTAADFFTRWDRGNDRARHNAMVTYARMTVAARAAVQAEIAIRIGDGNVTGHELARLVAFRAGAACATQVYSPDHGVTFHCEPTVTPSENEDAPPHIGRTFEMYIHAEQNYVESAEMCKAMGLTTLLAVEAALAAAGFKTERVTHKVQGKRYVWRQTGYHHMNQWCCTGRTATLRIVETE